MNISWKNATVKKMPAFTVMDFPEIMDLKLQLVGSWLNKRKHFLIARSVLQEQSI